MIVDPRTVILLAGIMGGLIAMVLWAMRRSYPSTIVGIGEWAGACALMFFSTLLLGARGMVHDLLSIVLANLALLCALALFLIGSARFLGRPAHERRWAALVFAMAPLLLWYTVVDPDYAARTVIVTFLMVVLTGSNAWLLLRHGSASFATRLVAAALAVQTVVQAIRFASALQAPADASLFLLSPAQTWFVTSYAFCMLLVGIGVALMATEKLRTEFEHLASHDSLTGALTRRAFLDACHQELERARRKDRPTSLLLMDLDHFKAINDTYGHQAGDRVLVDFVARVNALLRRPDHFGRFGGEEFVALLPETALSEAHVVAERIRAGIESGGQQPGCTVSIGIATTAPGETNIDTLLTRADEALYRAKAAGRNRVEATG